MRKSNLEDRSFRERGVLPGHEDEVEAAGDEGDDLWVRGEAEQLEASLHGANLLHLAKPVRTNLIIIHNLIISMKYVK